MAGILYAIAAGIIIAMQGAMNSRVNEKAGVWMTTTFVHGTGFIVSLLLYLWLRGGSLDNVFQLNKGYLLGGVLGVGIVVGVTLSIGQLGAAYAVAIVLVAELVFALAIDSFGLFGSPRVAFEWNRIIGVVVMIAGILIFKWK
ncbi:DMT family transporter [Cohnella nanjingensis]|uniref:DMT family transporter n=1 Tax=Cohnella nanjingensis TaxID=1387779 RepID=A0A7X0VDZ5_9BACL|nr:DMT family transporter [Cohnella nanjingensis]MBB6670196.1 DMT family transporter [Cohnella nanjingensis]